MEILLAILVALFLLRVVPGPARPLTPVVLLLAVLLLLVAVVG